MIDSLCGSLPSLTLYLLLSTFPLHVAAVAVTRCFDSPINGPNQALLVYSPQDPSTSTGGSVVLTTEVVYSTVYADDPLSSSPSTYMTSPQPSVSSSAIINRPVASTSPSTTSAPSASAQPTLAPNPTQNSTMSKNSTSGYRSVAYFTNWGIYGRKFFPQSLPSSSLTHVLYAFANIQESGTVILSDTWSDQEIHLPGDSWNDPGTNLYGCFKQLGLLKKANRNLKVLLSIGGWSYSPNFALPVSTAKGRAEFARSAVQLVQDNGLDGLDIDWEFPKNAGQAQNFVDLLGAVRDALSNYTAVHGGNRLLLTTASPAGPWAYKMLLLKQMDQYLDFWNMMAYDYSGSWDPKAAHQANLFLKLNDTDATPFNTQQAVDYYINQGIALDKIVIGMPLYGRSFEKTTGPGGNYSGVGSPDQEAGAWEAGVWDYKSLPRTGAQENIDDSAGASYSYDSISREMISYDNVEMSRRKAEYIVARGLGGGMWWESSGDKPFGKGSLIEAVSTILKAKGGLEASSNTIGYPGSKFDNVKRGFSV